MAVKGFVSPPDYFDPVASTSETKRLAAFIAALLISVFFYFGQRWSLRSNAKGWAIATILFALALIVSNQIFRDFKSHCTCTYDAQTVLIGTEYTQVGMNNFAKHKGNLSCEDILMNVAGRADRIWTVGSINACRRNLMLLYLTTFSLAALSLLSALQIVKCQKARK